MTRGFRNIYWALPVMGALALGLLLPGVTRATEVDTGPPSAIRNLRQTSAIPDLTPVFEWSDATDDTRIQSYWVRIDGGRAERIGLTPVYETPRKLRDGEHTIEVYARDVAGHQGPSVSLEFVAGDILPPEPPTAVRRTSDDTDSTPSFTWAAAIDNVAVTEYEVQLTGTFADRPYVNWKKVGNVLSYTVPDRNKLTEVRAGKLTFSVRAVDAIKNKSVPAIFDFWPPGAWDVPAPNPPVYQGRLMKLPDDHNPGTTGDAVVYYLGRDGKRYLFPSEGAYKSWYESFSFVQEVSEHEFSLIPIGGVVTHRPGTTLVKFRGDPKVYAVSKGGVLRHLQSEGIARDLYDPRWNTEIDELDETLAHFFTFGNGIWKRQHYDRQAQRTAATTISIDKEL